jgi:hypothetical protein
MRNQGGGRTIRANRDRPLHPVPPSRALTEAKVSADVRRAVCPTCAGPIAPWSFGRPRTYCSIDCRREMYRRRRELAGKEGELVDARQKAVDGYAPGRDFWRQWAAMHERQLAELRRLIPEAMR